MSEVPSSLSPFGPGDPRRASLVQDLWLGREPRLRGRRLAPFEEPEVRIVFVPHLGESLDERPLREFLETLSLRAEVIAYEPRSAGATSPGTGLVEDLERLLRSVEIWWPRGLPLVLAGHGLGATLALSAAAEHGARGVVALGPWLPPLAGVEEAFAEERSRSGELDQVRDLLGHLELGERLEALDVFLLAGRQDSMIDQTALRELSSRPRAVLASVPGGFRAPLEPPWPQTVAAWAAEVVRSG